MGNAASPSTSETPTSPPARAIADMGLEELAQASPVVKGLLITMRRLQADATAMELNKAKAEIASLKDQVQHLQNELGRTIALLEMVTTGKPPPFRSKQSGPSPVPPMKPGCPDMYR